MNILKFFIITIIFFFSCTTFGYQGYISETYGGKKVNAIKVILDGKHKVVISPSPGGESLSTLVKRVGGVSGVNGGYFCPVDYPTCGGNYTNNMRVYKGKTILPNSTSFVDQGFTKGTNMFGFDRNGNVAVFAADGWTGRDFDTSGVNHDDVYYGIQNHPVILINGKNVTDESVLEEKMYVRGTKTFICSTQDESTIYMGSIGNIIVEEMSDYLKTHLGCYHAMNLDSGGSQAMIYNNGYKAGPGRAIVDAFVVVPVEKENIDEYDDVFKVFDEFTKKAQKDDEALQKNMPTYETVCDSEGYDQIHIDGDSYYYKGANIEQQVENKMDKGDYNGIKRYLQDQMKINKNSVLRNPPDSRFCKKRIVYEKNEPEKFDEETEETWGNDNQSGGSTDIQNKTSYKNDSVLENEKIYNEFKKEYELEKQKKLQEKIKLEKLEKKYELKLKSYYVKIDYLFKKDKNIFTSFIKKLTVLQKKYSENSDGYFLLDEIIVYSKSKLK